MRVNSVTDSTKAPSLAFKAAPEEKLFASLKDRDIRRIAWSKASHDVNDKKHKAIDNVLFYSLPLAGGISRSVFKHNPEFVSSIGKHNMRALRLAEFAKGFGSWAVAIAALDMLWGAKDYLAKKVDAIKENPIISSVVTFAAGIGVLVLLNNAKGKAFRKYYSKSLEDKILPHLRNIRNALNESKILNKASEFLKKVPSPVKDMARTTAELAPLLVIGTQIGHSYGHRKVKAQVAAKNYEDLKQAQENIKELIADEVIDNKIE